MLKKSNAFSVLEVSLIFMFVAVTSYFGWQAFTNKSFDLLNLSAVHQNTAGGVNNLGQFFDNLKSKFAEMIAYLQNNKASEAGSEAYNNKRVETTGVIGQMIAAYKEAKLQGNFSLADKIKEAALDALKDLALNDAGTTAEKADETQTENAEKTAENCIASPSSCTTMMTITTLSGSLVWAQLTDKYYGSKFPIELSYSYKYIDNNGEIQTTNITQKVYIQKEQNDGSTINGVKSPYNIGKTYIEFLPAYLQSKLSASAATGSATEVQALMDKYTTGKDCVLSKSEGQYYDFATQRMYDNKNYYVYCSNYPDQCEQK